MFETLLPVSVRVNAGVSHEYRMIRWHPLKRETAALICAAEEGDESYYEAGGSPPRSSVT